MGYERCVYPAYFEQKADWKERDFHILFMARLWDTETIILDEKLSRDVYQYREYMKEERHQINKCRIDIMRKLSKEYGKFFWGGMYYDQFSEQVCPDLIVPKAMVRKKNYLDRMKKSDICIGTMGLHRSIGWKVGEYIAASRAIVSEKLEYVVPGNFEDGSNYYSFDNQEQCLEKIAKLYERPQKIYEMKKKNQKYYEEYLKPDIQIINALRQCEIELDYK